MNFDRLFYLSSRLIEILSPEELDSKDNSEALNRFLIYSMLTMYLLDNFMPKYIIWNDSFKKSIFNDHLRIDFGGQRESLVTKHQGDPIQTGNTAPWVLPVKLVTLRRRLHRWYSDASLRLRQVTLTLRHDSVRASQCYLCNGRSNCLSVTSTVLSEECAKYCYLSQLDHCGAVSMGTPFSSNPKINKLII